MRGLWLREFLLLGAIYMVALLAGLLADHVWLWLWLGTLGYLVLHLRNLYRLVYWLVQSRRYQPPEALGIWGEVFNQLYRWRRRERERKARLARMVEEFRHSTAAMPDGAVLLDSKNEIAWFNAAASRMLGLSMPRDAGQHISNLVRHPDFVSYLRHGDFEESVNIPSQVQTGISLSLQVVPYGMNQRLLLAKDVTRMRRLEQIRREFVANASHELRSPLTVMRGYVEAMVADDALQSNWSKPLAEMSLQCDRMNSIVDDLLELSRLETEPGEAPRDEIDIAELLSRVRAEAMALGTGPSDITLSLESAARLAGVKQEIHSAVSNIVSNAMKYTPADGQVRIRWYDTSKGAAISVDDTGVGIAPEHIPRLTERFYRVNPGRQRDAGGTGLGLAIVKHVLQRHGGVLRIESQPGKGSTFVCEFPVSRLVR